MVSWAAFIFAVCLFVEASAPSISPVTFLVTCALQSIAIILCQVAAARSFIITASHSLGTLFAVTESLVPETEAVSSEEGGCLIGSALLKRADPLFGLTAALLIPEETAFSFRASKF